MSSEQKEIAINSNEPFTTKSEVSAQTLSTLSSVSEERKVFKCSLCNLFARYDYFGRRPLERHSQPSESKSTLSASRNSKKESIILFEDSYVCDDPFSELKANNYLVIGSKCNVCNKMVCVSAECSFFYFKKRFCFKCATEFAETEMEFPIEIRNEIKKYIQRNQ